MENKIEEFKHLLSSIDFRITSNAEDFATALYQVMKEQDVFITKYDLFEFENDFNCKYSEHIVYGQLVYIVDWLKTSKVKDPRIYDESTTDKMLFTFTNEYATTTIEVMNDIATVTDETNKVYYKFNLITSKCLHFTRNGAALNPVMEIIAEQYR